MPQYIEMACPLCRHHLRVRNEYAGRDVRCRHCERVFHIPSDDVPRKEPSPPDRQGQAGGDLAEFEVPGYRMIGLLRTGAMGRVYKALQLGLDRVVVVKVLHGPKARDPEYLRRFRRESEVAARLRHPNIVRIIGAGDVDRRPYLVMEFAEGPTVQDRLASGPPFDEPEAATVALAVAEALAHIEGKGLIHRDIKPANVVLTEDREIKLLDMGLARPVDDEAWAKAEAGQAIGTPEYISPEQVRGQADVDIRSDIYSLGGTLYHMATGRLPYTGTSLEMMRQHVSNRSHPVPPSEINPALGGAFVAVLDKMLAKDREQRYRHPDDLAVDLRRVLQGQRSMAGVGHRPNQKA